MKLNVYYSYGNGDLLCSGCDCCSYNGNYVVVHHVTETAKVELCEDGDAPTFYSESGLLEWLCRNWPGAEVTIHPDTSYC